MQESEGVLCMRVSFRIALAGQVIGVSALYEQTRTFCKNYLTDAPASFEVAVTPADIAFEREKNDREAAVEGHAPGNFSDEYLETLALYRKIVERLLEWDTLLFHLFIRMAKAPIRWYWQISSVCWMQGFPSISG